MAMGNISYSYIFKYNRFTRLLAGIFNIFFPVSNNYHAPSDRTRMVLKGRFPWSGGLQQADTGRKCTAARREGGLDAERMPGGDGLATSLGKENTEYEQDGRQNGITNDLTPRPSLLQDIQRQLHRH